MTSRRGVGWANLQARSAGGGRVLIVEDSVDIRHLLQRRVTGLGYSVRCASSAEEADSYLRSEDFDACLLDIELPGMSGLDFLPWCLTVRPELPVIMLTAVDSADVALRCLEAGARNYLVKPFSEGFLRQALHDAVALGGLLRQHNQLTRQGAVQAL